MQNIYEIERKEVFNKVKNAAQVLLDTALQMNARLTDNDDIADISNDAYCDLVDMLKKLGVDYDIECMTADALVD